MDESPSTPAPTITPDWDTPGSDDSQDLTSTIPAHLYIQRVAALHADGQGFSVEFQKLTKDFNKDKENKENGKKKNSKFQSCEL